MSYRNYNREPELTPMDYINKYKYVIVSTISGIILIILFFLGIPFYTVNAGYVAIQTRLGAIVQCASDPGIYFKYPFIDSINYIDIRIKKGAITTEAFSHDLQTVDIEVALNYRVLDALSLFKNVGGNYHEIIIDPLTQESVKAVIAKYTAENLTQQRHEAKEWVKKDLKAALKDVYIELVDFNFIHVDFHKDFIHAIEAKQIAEQQAKQAKFLTEKVKEEMAQAKLRADANAYAMKIQREIVDDKVIELKKIEKWDGKLPQIVTNGIPLFNIPS